MSARLKVPKYRHYKPRDLAVVRLNGKDHYLGPFRSKASREKYHRLIAEWMLRGQQLPDAAGEPITLAELMVSYLQHAATYYTSPDGRRTTEYNVIRAALRLLRRYDHIAATQFGPVALQHVRERMVELGWARRTINLQVRRIVRMFRWAASQEMLPETLHRSLATLPGLRQGRTTAPERPPVRPVEPERVDATLVHLPGVVGDMVRLQLLVGCRPDELCQIRPAQVDRGGDVWRYRPAHHKTQHHGKERVIFVGPLAQAVLAPYLLRDDSQYCFQPVESERKRRAAVHKQRVTPLNQGNRPAAKRQRRSRRPGQCYTTASYRRAIERACAKAQVIPWSPNQLRHARATLVRALFGLETSQAILGHANVRTTEIYAERNDNLAAVAAREVG